MKLKIVFFVSFNTDRFSFYMGLHVNGYKKTYFQTKFVTQKQIHKSLSFLY